MKNILQKIIHTSEYQTLKRLVLGTIYERILLEVYNLFHKEKTQIIDIPDDRDIMYDELHPVLGEVPKVFGKRSIENIQDQRQSPVYPGSSCGPHAMAHALQIIGIQNAPTGPEFSEMMKEAGLLHSWGSYLTDSPKLALQLGYITGYAPITTKEQFMQHLSTGQPILIGSNKLKFNWVTDMDRYMYMEAESFGHLWTTDTYYDTEGIWCVDSLVLYNKMKFLDWKLIDKLFPSRIAIFVDQRMMKIQEIKKEAKSILAIERKNNIKEVGARIATQKILEEKYQDKQAVQVGMRLALGYNTEDYMLT